MKLYTFIYSIFAFATCFQAASARTRELKSTAAISPDSGIYSTLSTADHLASSSSARGSGKQYPRRTLKSESVAGRIQYGQEATESQFPFVVYFSTAGEGTCSGSVIGPRTILTAAHCVVDSDTNEFISTSASNIYFNRGFVDYDYGTDAGEIANFFMPAIYKGDSESNLGDVALIELVDPIPSYIKPVALASAATKMPAGTVLTVAGWGEMDDRKMATKLMFTTGKVMNAAGCEDLHYQEFDYEIDDDHFCVAVPQDTMQTTCGGDSGGPYLIAKKGKAPVQVGATSYGPSGDCGSTMRLDVPVSIRYWRNWIDDTMSMFNMRGAQIPVKVNEPAYGQCFKGPVVRTSVTPTFGRCLELCRSPANAACQAWTWVRSSGACSLLTSKGTVTKSKECTSGYFN